MNAKYLVANIVNDRILVASVVTESELKQAVKQMADLARDSHFDVDEFCEEGSSGASEMFSNGTAIQFLYLGENT